MPKESTKSFIESRNKAEQAAKAPKAPTFAKSAPASKGKCK